MTGCPKCFTWSRVARRLCICRIGDFSEAAVALDCEIRNLHRQGRMSDAVLAIERAMNRVHARTIDGWAEGEYWESRDEQEQK